MSDKPKRTYKQTTVTTGQPAAQDRPEAKIPESDDQAREIGGPKGPEPTRFGDWEHKGRCIDF